METASLHLNVVSCIAKRQAKHIKIIIWSQWNIFHSQNNSLYASKRTKKGSINIQPSVMYNLNVCHSLAVSVTLSKMEVFLTEFEMTVNDKYY